MEHYCRNCKETRFFRLKQQGVEHDIYECSYCYREWKRLTGTGAAIIGAKIGVRVLGLLIGFPPPDPLG